jgi:hypothetical protein
MSLLVLRNRHVVIEISLVSDVRQPKIGPLSDAILGVVLALGRDLDAAERRETCRQQAIPAGLGHMNEANFPHLRWLPLCSHKEAQKAHKN